MIAIFEKTKYTNYYISTDGKVFSSTIYLGNNKWREKKLTLNKRRGYVYVRTTTKNYQVHRLVASAFLDNKYNKKTVNHKNGNKQDNRVENLEWNTYKENAQHAVRNHLTKKLNKNEGNLKYSNKECKEVLERIKSGMTYIKAGIKFNMPYSTVAHLVRGSRRKI